MVPNPPGGPPGFGRCCRTSGPIYCVKTKSATSSKTTASLACGPKTSAPSMGAGQTRITPIELGSRCCHQATADAGLRRAPPSAAGTPARHPPGVHTRRVCDAVLGIEGQLEHRPVVRLHSALGGLAGEPVLQRGGELDVRLLVAVASVFVGPGAMMCDTRHIAGNHVESLLHSWFVDSAWCAVMPVCSVVQWSQDGMTRLRVHCGVP